MRHERMRRKELRREEKPYAKTQDGEEREVTVREKKTQVKYGRRRCGDIYRGLERNRVFWEPVRWRGNYLGEGCVVTCKRTKRSGDILGMIFEDVSCGSKVIGDRLRAKDVIGIFLMK